MNVVEVEQTTKAHMFLLHSAEFQIYPYARGSFYPADTLYALWWSMKKDGTLGRVLYEAEHLDLETFVDYFRPDHSLLFIATTPDNATILGAVWFTCVRLGRAQIGLWFAKSAYGHMAQDITNRVLCFVFATHGWQCVFGLTPWKAAMRLGLRLGFKHIATVPEFIALKSGKLLPLHIIRLDNMFSGVPDVDLVLRRISNGK